MIEEQHPIPQQISSYQFRLVGDMTLKQFFQVAGGALIALLLYSTGLPSYIKWPLILLSFLSGVAFAFLPFQDRPLSVWLISFFKSIYEPTLYIWKQGPGRDFFSPEKTVPPAPSFQTPSLAPVVAAPIESSPRPVPVISEHAPETPFDKFQEAPPSPAFMHIPAQKKPAEPVLYEARGAPQVSSTGYEVKIPETLATEVGRMEKNEEVTVPQKKTSPDVSFISPAATTAQTPAKPAQFTPEAAPPLPPGTPNVVVGQVVADGGKIVENAILEIKDSEGRSVRALKSNKLGHFMIVTPLLNGTYQITAEKEGLVFEPSAFEAKGEIITPILVTGKSGSQGNQVFVSTPT